MMQARIVAQVVSMGPESAEGLSLHALQAYKWTPYYQVQSSHHITSHIANHKSNRL